eukprot:gene7216-8010_t
MFRNTLYCATCLAASAFGTLAHIGMASARPEGWAIPLVCVEAAATLLLMSISAPLCSTLLGICIAFWIAIIALRSQ